MIAKKLINFVVCHLNYAVTYKRLPCKYITNNDNKKQTNKETKNRKLNENPCEIFFISITFTLQAE